MKYVGPQTFNASGAASTNPNAEINADGSFVDDPEGNAASFGGKYSGFINYLNKFGTAVQLNPPTGSLGGAGEYKRYDTMAEMYYEAIRYYQNLTPTPQTYGPTSGVAYPNQINGYFPMLSGTTWPADPIVQQCANNYIVNIADTDTWDDVYLPGYAGVPAQNSGGYANYLDHPHVFRPTSRAADGRGTALLDAHLWTQKIGALEYGTTSLTSNDVRPQMYNSNNSSYPVNANTIQDVFTGSQDTATYFSAGAAYWANTNDIRPDLPALANNAIHSIKTISVDSGGQTRPVWDRQLYLMGKYGGFNVPTTARSDGTQNNPFYATNPANPTGPGIRSNSEWESAPGSGYPANYLRASSPQALITGLQAAFSSISASSGTASGGSLTSASLNYGTAGTFISQFSNARWSGTVLNEAVTSVNGVFTVSTTPTWDAGALLTTQCGTVAAASSVCIDTYTGATKRNIYTTINVSGTRQAKAFTNANITQTADFFYWYALNVNPSSGLTDGLGSQRLNYLRGYRADEASSLGFRPRDSVMGDVINSAPIYKGPPSSSIPDSDYQSFFLSYYNRTAAVYVGANDGMMHAFNASTGAELFAYIPNFIASYLSDLTNAGYTHEPFVDSIPVVQEAKVNGNWKTVLVSGTGAGGQGVFALDVTDPTAFDTTKVLFEFTDADDADLGNVMFSPAIVKLQTGTSGGVPTYGYFAAVTAYNNKRAVCKSPGNFTLLYAIFPTAPACSSNSQGDTYVSSTANNKGVLFLLSLDRTLGTAWTLGTNYYKYYFPANSTTTQNGLGPVSALLSKSGSGAADALYFGDLQGDLWRLNTVGAPAAWTPSIGTVAAAQPIFKAVTSAGVAQPITARPELGTGPFGSTLISFGTGEYLGTSDLSTPYAQQTQYLLIDTNGSTQITRSANLTARTATVSGSPATIAIAGNSFSYTPNGTARGWYLDFPSTSTGERMINKAALVPGLLSFTSLTLASSVCGSGGGYVYQVNPVSGLPITTTSSPNNTTGGFASTVGIPGPPAIVTLQTSSGVTKGTGEAIGQLTQSVLVSGTSGQIAQPGASITQKGPPTSRVSWREITNYNDRH
jgi:type IV pilus assembly protein PilY1